LFLIGPRRFGKTSILRAAEAKLTDAGKVVLRYDAEAFDDIGSLAAALLAGAVRKYSSALDRAQAIAKKFFVALKPSLTLDPSDGKITVAVGVEPGARLGAVPGAPAERPETKRDDLHKPHPARRAWSRT